MCIINNVGCYLGWLVDDNLLLRDFVPYGIILHIYYVCVVVTVVIVMLLRDFDLSFILSVNTKHTNNLKYDFNVFHTV
jgi:hypothetical protein